MPKSAWLLDTLHTGHCGLMKNPGNFTVPIEHPGVEVSHGLWGFYWISLEFSWMYGAHGPLVLLAVQERQAGKIIVRGFGVWRLLQMANNSGRIIVE